MNNTPKGNMEQHIEENDTINIKDILNKLFDKWPWFILSIIICSMVAFLYANYTPPNYQINAKILVGDDDKGGGIGKQASSLMDLGG
ncbi:hypothetical protein G7074_08000 [Pedobacter sp. HDW13]|uniref:Wzz/FepE/Etk N-terminal domain-containing protein n=1 Tax=Pedobacter sp. HDW13 TaxID=2714940 RepID=UPI0014083D51|nr:Wzz/FepE/Etk N-terminal domain-containing protein [Pedobacter sp. HDW13]QIL39222.1 hypothetical protein G7074_08000 [Pedobacter sp. HDW13]